MRLACFFEMTPLLAALRIVRSALRSAPLVSSATPPEMAVRASLTAVRRPLRMWRLPARRLSD